MRSNDGASEAGNGASGRIPASKRPRALLVDDEPEFAEFIRDAVASHIRADVASDSATAIQQVRRRSYDVVFLDVDLGAAETGVDLLKRLKSLEPDLPVIMLTKSVDVATIVESIKSGAFYYVTKGTAPAIHEIIHMANLAIEDARLRRTASLLEDDAGDPLGAMRGRSPAMARIKRDIARVASLDCTVLITGDSGTGKELVARALHGASRRSRRRFVAINCGALPDRLVESELFGHEKGAFTGAERRRVGKFEYASGGTLFLDEIGDTPAATQAKLLRVLETKEFERVGGNQVVETDARIISATNRDLEAATASGAFREDLYYRVNEFTIHVPPLRERPEDIREIAPALVDRIGREIGKRDLGISEGAVDLLSSREWRRSNVRELRNAILGAAIRCEGGTLLPVDFPAEGFATLDAVPQYAEAKKSVVEQFQRRYFTHLLRLTGGNVAAAAEKAGIHRAVFHRHLTNLGIEADEFRQGGAHAHVADG